MRRALLIPLSLVLVLVGWSTAGAADFYVIPVVKEKYAPVPKTGQNVSEVTGDDGDLQKGVASPSPRFTDNGNGTVTDNLTGLIWAKNANAFDLRTWSQAVSDANSLEAGYGGLTDGSKPGDWRLPNIRELESLIDYGNPNRAYPGTPFINIGGDGGFNYWSSTFYMPWGPAFFWYVNFEDGTRGYSWDDNLYYVWCVRGGK